MNFCGQQHNKNRKRDQKHLHVLPKNWAFLSGCRRKQNEGPRSLPLCHSQKVRQQIMGAESGLLFPLGHAFFFFVASWTDVQQVGAQFLYGRRRRWKWRRRSPPPKPLSIQSSTGSTSKTPGIFLGSQLVKPPEITHGSWITPSSGDVTLIFRQHTHTTTHTRAAGDKKVQK